MKMSQVKYADIAFYGTDVASNDEAQIYLNMSGIAAYTQSGQPLYTCAWNEVYKIQIKKRDQCIIKITLHSGLKKKLKLTRFSEIDRFFVATQAYANVKKAAGWFMGRRTMYIKRSQNEVQPEVLRRAAVMEVSMERVEFSQVTMVKSPVNEQVPPPPPPPPMMAELEPSTSAIATAPVPMTAVPTQAPDFVAELKANFAKGLLMPKERPKLPTNIVIRKQEMMLEQSQVVSSFKVRKQHNLSAKVMTKVTYDDLVAEVKQFQAKNLKPSDIKGTKIEKIVETVEESYSVMESTMTVTSVINLTMVHESTFCASSPENLPVVTLTTPKAKFVPRRPKELIWEFNELDNRYEDEPIPVVVEQEQAEVPEPIVVIAEVHQNPEPELVPEEVEKPAPQEPEQKCRTKSPNRKPLGSIDELKAFAYAFKQQLKPSDVREYWRQTDRPLEVPSSEEEWSEELTGDNTSTPIRQKETPVVENAQQPAVKKHKTTPKSHVDALKEYFAKRTTPPKIVGAILKNDVSAFSCKDIAKVLDHEEAEPDMSGMLEDFDWQSPEFTKRQDKPHAVQQRRHSCPAPRFRPSLCSILEDDESLEETRPFVPFEIYEDGDQEDGHVQSEKEASSPEREMQRPFAEPPSPTGAEKDYDVGYTVPLPGTSICADYRTLCHERNCCDWNPNRSKMGIMSVDGLVHRIPVARFWKEYRAGVFEGRDLKTLPHPDCHYANCPRQAEPTRLRFPDQECTHHDRFCDCSANLD